MNLKDKLEKEQYGLIWENYCGFLDLTMDEYMAIQKRLMEEQIRMWSRSTLGQSILRGRSPKTIEEFRKMVPLTSYEDYSDILLQKKGDLLPDNPVIWIQTTWEGGKHPIKVAPYTRSMLDTFSTNVAACLILATTTQKGHINVDPRDKLLYGLAPLPYATGLLPHALNEHIDIQFLPPVKEAEHMTFSERNKLGFKMAMQQDVERKQLLAHDERRHQRLHHHAVKDSVFLLQRVRNERVFLHRAPLPASGAGRFGRSPPPSTSMQTSAAVKTTDVSISVSKPR